MLILKLFFVLCSLFSAMHRTMATSEENKGPIDNYSPGYAIYYMSFVVVFSFFFLNIFVALIILTFQEEGEREIASCELDRNQVTSVVFTNDWECTVYTELSSHVNKSCFVSRTQKPCCMARVS